MPSVLFREPPAELEAWLALRRERGQDKHDEVWEGTYIVNPIPRIGHEELVLELGGILRRLARPRGLKCVAGVNLGQPDDFRCSDITVVPGDTDPDTLWFERVPLLVEIRSPHDDTDAKLPYYLAKGVDEVVVVDWRDRSVVWLAAIDGAWVETERSDVLDVAVADVVAEIDWP